eukprot:1148778-Pelagomonas_calceolata.AAC.6
MAMGASIVAPARQKLNAHHRHMHSSEQSVSQEDIKEALALGAGKQPTLEASSYLKEARADKSKIGNVRRLELINLKVTI